MPTRGYPYFPIMSIRESEIAYLYIRYIYACINIYFQIKSNGKPAYFNPDPVNDPDDFDCDGDYQSPTIVQAVFPNTPSSWVWSGSPSASYSHFAWYASFYSGNDGNDYRNGSGHVRLVRSGQ